MKLLYIHTFIVIFAALKDIFKQKGIIMKTLGYLGAFVALLLVHHSDFFLHLKMAKIHVTKLHRLLMIFARNTILS